MQNEPILQARETKRGWLRRMPWWQKGGLAFLLIFAVIFVNAYFATRRGGFQGRMTADQKMEFRAHQLGYADAQEMWSAGGGPWGPAKAAAAPSPSFAPEAPRAEGETAPTEADQAIIPAGGAPAFSLETWGRQLILNATLSFEVKEVRAVYDNIQSAAAAEGALITSANLQSGRNGSDEDTSYGSATLVLRMPQSRFHAVRQRLLSIAGELKGKVLQDQVSTEDVTEQFVDLRARLRHWKSQEVQLLAIMGQARKISDILAVRDQISGVQQEIERLSGQLRFLESRVDLSTITVNLYQKGKAPVKPTKPSIASTLRETGKQISAAGTKSLQDVVKVLGMIAIAATYLLPFAAIAALVWLSVRSARKRAVPGPRV